MNGVRATACEDLGNEVVVGRLVLGSGGGHGDEFEGRHRSDQETTEQVPHGYTTTGRMTGTSTTSVHVRAAR